MRRPLAIILGLALLVVALTAMAAGRPAGAWSEDERALVLSLRLSTLEPLPADPTNRVADDPRAVALGHRIFFDTRFSSNGKVACATCHDPAREFQDGTPLAKGVGTTDRRTMPIASTARSPWQFWDGRKDSQWAQALGPLESPVEHGGTREQYARVVAERYRNEYEAIFGRMPSVASADRDAITRIYVNIGKSIAAYERRIAYGPSRFDAYAESLAVRGRAPTGILSDDEEAGLRLFVGKAQCSNCHNGPLFTDDHFHNTGVPQGVGRARDDGRASGAKLVQADEFNCRSRWSDAPTECAELDYMVAEGAELERAFKTPSLRNVAERAPYMHAGQFATLEQVVAHYQRAAAAPQGRTELRRLRLDAREQAQLVAFLRALSAPLETPRELLGAPR